MFCAGNKSCDILSVLCVPPTGLPTWGAGGRGELSHRDTKMGFSLGDPYTLTLGTMPL